MGVRERELILGHLELAARLAANRKQRPLQYATPSALAQVDDSRWLEPPHIKALDAALLALSQRHIRRLIVEMPPRHGKSFMCSKYFPAWYLSQHPEQNVILASYEANFATLWGRRVRDVVTAHSERLGFALREDSKGAGAWETTQGGGMFCTGVGGPMTGRGANVLIIDDPVKNRDEAESVTYRERTWEWWQSTAYTRLEPDAVVIVIMCMTGDTPVLMADGTELPLREIKVGDQVATYDNGRLATSTVRNHRSNGPDSVFRITTTCGKIVHANERHPFLVEENGQLKWIRLKNLTTAHKIVTVRDSGENGRERHAPLRAVRNPLAPGAIALRTTARSSGQMGIAHRQSIQSHAAARASSIGTESLPPIMTQCMKRKTASALSANSPQATMYARIGVGNCASITATKQIPLGDFYAMTVTSPWDMPRQRQQHLPLPNIFDFTTAQIKSIEPAGVEEVFDIQIERTENFIANGLVSHNTRWHSDDLAGRLLRQVDDGEPWEVLRLPAIAEEDDPVGRAEGEALWPERYAVGKLYELRRRIGEYWWASLYQQRPAPREGALWKWDWIEQQRVEVPPQLERIVIAIDPAGSTRKHADQTGIVLAAKGEDRHYYVMRALGLRVSPNAWAERAAALYQNWRADRIVAEKNYGGEMVEATLRRVRPDLPITMVQASRGKVLRAEPIAALYEQGRVHHVGRFGELEEQMTSFPVSNEHDDLVDALVYALTDLMEAGGEYDDQGFVGGY